MTVEYRCQGLIAMQECLLRGFALENIREKHVKKDTKKGHRIFNDICSRSSIKLSSRIIPLIYGGEGRQYHSNRS